MDSANVTEVTDANFQQEVLSADLPVLIDFWATWCAPCKAIAPHVASLADENAGKLKVVKVDVQRNMKVASQFGVTNIPTLLVVKGGKEVGRQVGAQGGLHALKKLVSPHL